jgi:transposase
MAPTLRGARFDTPSPELLAGRDATTTRKCRFFNALARNGGTKSMRRISKDCGITKGTGRYWKKQWESMGPLAKRSTRQRSSILGRNSKISKSTYKMLVSPTQNPVRKEPLGSQIAYHNLPIKTRQLRRKLKDHTKGSGQYLCAFIKKKISDKNREGRTTYRDNYIYDPIFGYFDHIVFTDEAHVDPTSRAQGRVL